MSQVKESYIKVLKGSDLSSVLDLPKDWELKQVEVKVTLIPSKKKKFKYAGGSLQKYANPKLNKLEKKGIELALKEKYESNRR
ncbi:MAG: hypothetical protein KDK36_16135 [Leptospiraceae bacterium]|nr:hypothetical protein [Leptospiraceae bacterium]